MNDWLSDMIEQIRALPAQRQLMLAVAGLGSLAFVGWISLGMGSLEYRALYRGLAEDETARVAEALRAENIDYRLEDGATTITVPSQQVYEARIRVAGRGLPGGGSTGFEIFDRPAFGVTDFVHRVNYTRAVQGELARSIEQLESVTRARVQVVIPERKTVLAARERSARASVVVKLAPGRELDKVQAKAIVHLVASSVEALSPADVTVVDDGGRLLAPLGSSDEESMQVGGAPAHQARIESELAQRIEAILEPVVGTAGVVARVRAEMDWTKSDVTEERFDPESQVARSEQRTEETESEAVDGGVPGIESNTQEEGSGVVAEASPTSSRVSETYNYEISKVVSRRSTPMGKVERLSVAVLVDSGTTGAGDEEGSEAQGFSPEQLERFEELAKQAVGFSEKRGDHIVVTAEAFRPPEVLLEGDAPVMDGDLMLLLSKALGIVAQLLILFLFAQFIVRPLLAAIAEKSAGTALPAPVSSLEAELAGAGADVVAPPATLAEQVGAEAQIRNEDSVTTIRNWLNQG